MAEPSTTRRAVIRTAPALAAASLAGCQEFIGRGPPPTRTPELPNVEKRTIQRDRAAVTHIFSLVEGRIEWPAIDFRNDGIDEVVGTWESDVETLTLNPDTSFVAQGSDYTHRGTYVANEGESTLYLQFEDGTEANYRYERTERDSGATLELHYDGGTVGPYRRTSGEPSTEDSLEMIKHLRIVPADGSEAGTEGSELQSGATGSGFIVSADGYVVTNAHVVLADEEPGMLLFRKLAGQFSRALRQNLREDLADENLSEAELAEVGDVMFEKLIDYLLEHGSLGQASESFHVLNGRARPDESVEVESWPARVVGAGTVRTEVDGETTWGRDVAVLSVDQSNLPVVSLGSAEGLTTGDEIFVVGYPSIGIENLFEGRETALEPTLTTGVVSARRRLKSGIDSIQTDAAINNGNSGGPMYDSNGEVVGIATFAPASPDVEAVGFGLPVSVVTEAMDELGVAHERGEMDRAFDAGLSAYWRGDCETAIAKFEDALELYPDHPYAREFVENCESGEAPGRLGRGG